MKKYEFTGETKQINGVTLRRIKRLSDGLVGGWIEKEENLSHEGECFVYGSAQVSDYARVFGSAQVFGSAWATSHCSETPINIGGLKYKITIMDSVIRWGCHEFDLYSLEQFTLSDCTETWDADEFETTKRIIIETAKMKWGIDYFDEGTN